jgi:hypothetical protein
VRHRGVNDLSRTESDEDEREDRTEEEIVGLEEVANPDLIDVRSQER